MSYLEKALLMLTACLGAVWLVAQPAMAEMAIDVDDIAIVETGKNDFIVGQIIINREPVWWISDTPWRITVEALDHNLGSSDDGTYTKPLSDLQFKLSEESGWTAIRQFPEVLKESNQTGRGSFTVDWRVLLEWQNDRPGRYETTLLFTISEA